MGVGGETEDQWLEEVEGVEPLAWRDEQNTTCLATLGQPTASPLHDAILKTLDSDEKLTPLTKIDNYYYNFWIDSENPRGLWRRLSSLEGLGTQDWELVLDVDALAAEDGVSWVWHGAVDMLEQPGKPHDLVLLELSRGGSDAAVIREFSLATKSFIEGGFEVPEAKSQVSYKGPDTLLVSSAAIAATTSGYARTVQEWQRGTELADAPTVFEARETDMMTSGSWFIDRGVVWERRHTALDFYTSEQWLSQAGGPLVKLPVPADMQVSTFGDMLLCTLRSEWLGFAGGSLLVCDASALLQLPAGTIPNVAEFMALFTPSDTASLEGVATTKNFVILTLLDTVKSKLVFWEYGSTGWVQLSEAEQQLDKEANELASVSVRAVDPDHNDSFWMMVDGFTTPTVSYVVNSPRDEPRPLQSLPALFDASGCTVTQHITTSLDGTAVPYFEVTKAPSGSPSPTLLYGYGGFEISMTPAYSPTVGVGWLEKGGTYVVGACDHATTIPSLGRLLCRRTCSRR